MKFPRIFGLLWILVLVLLLGFSSAVLADDSAPMLNDARADLEKAWNPGGDPPSVADRTKLLKDALALLKQAPRGPGLYSRHLQAAKRFINSALYELDKGDVDKKATDLIHSAVEEVRDIT
jgi:hypothetical protein